MSDLYAHTPVDYGLQAQAAAENRLAACWNWLDAEEEGEQPEGTPPGVGPFCGCRTCEVRETLDAAWPFLLEQAKAELAEDAEVTAGARPVTP